MSTTGEGTTDLAAASHVELSLPRVAANLSDAQQLAVEASNVSPGFVNARIAVVAAEAIKGKLLSGLESGGFADLCPASFSQALPSVRKWLPDVLVLHMADETPSGLDILSAVRADETLRDLPVLSVVKESDFESKSRAWKAGASEFISDRVDAFELVTRVSNMVSVSLFKQHLSDHQQQLNDEVAQRTLDLKSSNQQLVYCLARAAELRDDETGQHVRRVGAYAALIARDLGFDELFVTRIELAAQLHDIGKLGLPDRILLKNSPLDASEYAEMKQHCAIGREIVQESVAENERLSQKLLEAQASGGEVLPGGSDSELMQMAARIAQTHHEHWDGSGYPLGLAGEEIPIEGRITAVADAYDALSCNRPFRDALPRRACFDFLKEHRGQQFAPDVVDAFLRDIDAVIAIQIQYAD